MKKNSTKKKAQKVRNLTQTDRCYRCGGIPEGMFKKKPICYECARGKNSEASKAGLARHIAAVYNHPLTPARLYNAIGDFITTGTNLKVSVCEFPNTYSPGDVSLVEEWSFNPQTIERVIELSNKYDSAEEASRETLQA